jgi:hypothetical protein
MKNFLLQIDIDSAHAMMYFVCYDYECQIVASSSTRNIGHDSSRLWPNFKQRMRYALTHAMRQDRCPLLCTLLLITSVPTMYRMVVIQPSKLGIVTVTGVLHSCKAAAVHCNYRSKSTSAASLYTTKLALLRHVQLQQLLL